jgi:hypothetical protein
MTESTGRVDLNHILRTSAQELMDCHQDMVGDQKPVSGIPGDAIRPDEQKSIEHLLETLDTASTALEMEIESGRVIKIDPKTLLEMEIALDTAMNVPNVLDAKINEIYLSVFGFNTPLWHALRSMQKLLQTSEFLKSTRGAKVAKVEKMEKERRKKRNQ